MRNVSIYIAAKELALVTKGKMQSHKSIYDLIKWMR